MIGENNQHQFGTINSSYGQYSQQPSSLQFNNTVNRQPELPLRSYPTTSYSNQPVSSNFNPGMTNITKPSVSFQSKPTTFQSPPTYQSPSFQSPSTQPISFQSHSYQSPPTQSISFQSPSVKPISFQSPTIPSIQPYQSSYQPQPLHSFSSYTPPTTTTTTFSSQPLKFTDYLKNDTLTHPPTTKDNLFTIKDFLNTK